MGFGGTMRSSSTAPSCSLAKTTYKMPARPGAHWGRSKAWTCGTGSRTRRESGSANDKLACKRAILQATVKASGRARVAGRPSRVRDDQKCVLIAIDADFLDIENMAGGFTLAPQFFAGARPEMRLARRDRGVDRLLVHMRDHQHRAGLCVRHDSRDQSCRIEFRQESKALLSILGISRAHFPSATR